MTRFALDTLRLSIAVALCGLPASLLAASGEFTFVVGDVSLQKANGQKSAPARGTPVDAGDRIITGPNGMAQLNMVDQARLSLRPNTQFVIEAYPDKRDSNEGAVLSLLRGTLRTFTGLIASGNRDRYVMKTRVATVGIRGSGNILYACDPGQCDPSVVADATNDQPLTVNHTIEGSHAVTNIGDPNLPAQQGGAQTLITGPGQTVLVAGSQPPRYIPTPSFIADAATTMAGAKPAAGSTTTVASETRNFSPSDTPALPPSQQITTQVVTTNPVGFVNPVDATLNLGGDPLNLRDIVITVAGSPFSGQAIASEVNAPNDAFRGYTSYAGTQAGVQPAIVGGNLVDTHQLSADGVNITMGRYTGAGIGFFGPSTGSSTIPGSIHWIEANSGYPTYLSDVLTGTASYTLVSATQPTNQNNTAGTLGSAQLDVNFTARTLGLNAALTIPAAGGNNGGSWTMTASNVPLSLNAFFTSTSDTLVVNNGSTTSTQNDNLTGSVQGSLVGNGLGAAILGYGIQDHTNNSTTQWNDVTGVAALQGTRQPNGTAYREGVISDPAGTLQEFVRSYSTFDRSDEVVFDAQQHVTQFSAPFVGTGGAHSTYTLGTATVVESGFDPETGLTWGRWSGGQAVVTNGGQSVGLDLRNTSLHYIFAGSQSGPVALPLTGTASYSVLGNTSPTNGTGAVGTLNSATLDANFTNRTVNASVNIGIAGETWTGNATNMPIYRDQFFSAYSGTPVPGVPNPTPLILGCSPSCGSGATGSFSGFFAGSSGQRAGLMYNLGGNQGAIAFGRGPGG
ncbi:MAG TPA: FecR family protein [Usitatibacter sp.]|nr:FecR family protein [Usitatibacter sp.]